MRTTSSSRSTVLASPFSFLRLENPVAISVLLLALVGCVFLPSLRNGFVNYDDNLYVTDNPGIQAGVTSAGLASAFSQLHGVGTYWHPLTWVSHMVDCQLYGLRPWGHHLTNVLLHGVNTLLVFLLFRRMTGATWKSAFLAGFFALHPLQVDTVAWVAERKNLLSALFWLLTMLAYMRYVNRSTRRVPTGTETRPSPANHYRLLPEYVLLSLLFVCGLMCKPVLVTLPFVLLLADYWPLRRFQSASPEPAQSVAARFVLEKLPLFILAAASCVITLLSHQGLGMLDASSGLSWSLRIENAIVSYARYLGNTFWPFNLAVFYPYSESWPIQGVCLAAALMLAVSALTLRTVHRSPHLFFGWFWFVGVLVPFIGLIQVGAQPMADRFMYLPILGVLLLVVWGAEGLVSGRRYRQTVLAIVGTVLLVICGVASFFQVQQWRDSVTLFSHALAVTKNNALAECNLGNALGAQGHTREAIVHLNEAVRLSPNYAEAHVNLGVALATEGKTDEAIEHYRAAIKARPAYAQAHQFLAAALVVARRNDEAKRELLEALRINPGYPEAHTRLGYLLVLQGQPEDGLRHLLRALEIRDDCEDGHYYLAAAFARLGRMQEAVDHYRAALRVKSDHAPALNDLAWVLASVTDPGTRNVPEAIQFATRACKVTGYTNAAYLDTLGTALSEASRWQEAIAITEQAAAVAAAGSSQQHLVPQIQSHLQLFRAKIPLPPPLEPNRPARK